MQEILVYRRKETNCYQCGEPLDSETEATKIGTDPKPGDLSICFYCGALYEFDKTLTLQPALDFSLSKEERILVESLRAGIKANNKS